MRLSSGWWGESGCQETVLGNCFGLACLSTLLQDCHDHTARLSRTSCMVGFEAAVLDEYLHDNVVSSHHQAQVCIQSVGVPGCGAGNGRTSLESC